MSETGEMKQILVVLALVAVHSVPSTAVAQQAAQSLEQRVQVLERRVRTLSELVLRMDRLQQEVQQLRGEIELQSHSLEGIKKRQRDLYQDVDRRLGQIASPAAAVPSGAPVSGAAVPAVVDNGPAAGDASRNQVVKQSTQAGPAETRAYNQALELLTEQHLYTDARKALKSFLARYPAGQYADNAQYWLGEASYVTRDFDAAMTEFSDVLARFPDSAKVPSAILKMGYIEFERQQLTKSRQTLDQLIRRYPASSEARLAQEFIRKKGL